MIFRTVLFACLLVLTPERSECSDPVSRDIAQADKELRTLGIDPRGSAKLPAFRNDTVGVEIRHSPAWKSLVTGAANSVMHLAGESGCASFLSWRTSGFRSAADLSEGDVKAYIAGFSKSSHIIRFEHATKSVRTGGIPVVLASAEIVDHNDQHFHSNFMIAFSDGKQFTLHVITPPAKRDVGDNEFILEWVNLTFTKEVERLSRQP